jgi:hypothetical protein
LLKFFKNTMKTNIGLHLTRIFLQIYNIYKEREKTSQRDKQTDKQTNIQKKRNPLNSLSLSLSHTHTHTQIYIYIYIYNKILKNEVF